MPAEDGEPLDRREPDPVLVDLAHYALETPTGNDAACEAAFCCLLDALACGFEALQQPPCTRLLGPVVPGATLAGGARVPGTSYELDPVQAAFNVGTLLGWQNGCDAAFGAAWGHPSDSLGGLLAVADYRGRQALAEGSDRPALRRLLLGMIQAQEIRRVIGSERGGGLDRLATIGVSTAAVATAMLGGSPGQLVEAMANARLDGGSRRGWTTADATSRGVWHALHALRPAATALPGSGRSLSPAPAADLGRPRWGQGADVPRLLTRFESSLPAVFAAPQRERIKALIADPARAVALPVDQFMAVLVRN